MKVLIVRNAFSHDFGGAERLAVHLAQELEQNGITTTVISRQKKLLAYASLNKINHKTGWWWSRQDWSGLKALLFPFYFIWQLCLFFWYLHLITSTRTNALHLMSKDDFIAGTLAGKFLHKRVIWTDTADLKHVFVNHGVWYKNPVGKLVYFASNFADYIGLVSDSEKKLIRQSLGHTPQSQFQVMHIAGKDESVEPIGRSDHDKDAVIFCATSRLVYAKGITELITAFDRLSKTSDKYRLWLIGDGPDMDLFKEQASGNNFIAFFGHSETPLRYVASSDIFVHPTHHEGFSLSLSEAAMLGKPLLATNVGGNPELVNPGNGILVPVKDPETLAAAMSKLGTDIELRVRLGQQARADYKNNFDFSTIIKDRLIPLYGDRV